MIRWGIVAATLAIAAIPGWAWAQNGAASQDEPAAPAAPAADDRRNERSVIERWQERNEDLKKKGVVLSLGTVLSGSSLAAGVEVGRDRLIGTPIGASFAGEWSIRGYQQYDLRVGMMKGRTHRAELRPVDADIAATFNDNSLLAFGASIFVHVRQRVYPRIDFFGLGQQASIDGRTDYNLLGSSADVVVQWQRDRHYGVAGRVGRVDISLGEPTNEGVPDIDTVYTPIAAPGLDAQPRFMAAGAAFTADFRDKARLTKSGTFAAVALWRVRDRDGSGGWTRMVFDARHFVPVKGQRQVLALRFLMSTRLGHSVTPTPFYLQPTLGGSRTLRAFGSYRLRGEAVWTTSAEYRWRVAKHIEVAPFLDVGAVAAAFTALGTTGVAVSPGLGIRAVTDSNVIARADVARGRDGVRLIATIGAAF